MTKKSKQTSYWTQKVKKSWLEELNKCSAPRDPKFLVLYFLIHKSQSLKELKKYQSKLNNYVGSSPRKSIDYISKC